MQWQVSLGNDCWALYLAEAVMSDDVILLKLEEDYTCPITQACLFISIPSYDCHFAWHVLQLHFPLCRVTSQPCVNCCLMLRQYKRCLLSSDVLSAEA